MTTAWIGAICMIVIIPLQILLTFGAPLGEFSMGGKYKVFPGKLRMMSAVSTVILISMTILLLGLGGIIYFEPKLFFKYAGYICGAYFCLNTIMNLLSESKKEKFTMTPLSAILTVCFLYTTYNSPLWN